MVVFTGLTINAGTSSKVNNQIIEMNNFVFKKVHFILSGNDHETNIRTLTNSHQEILQRGSIDSFVFAVPK